MSRAHILGHSAGELIHEALLAKRQGIKFSKLHWMIHAYPTYSEIVKKAARKAYLHEMSSSFFVKLAKKLFGGKK